MPTTIDTVANFQQIISDWRRRKSELESSILQAKHAQDKRAEVDAKEKIKEERPVVKEAEEICPSCDLIAMVCTGRAPVMDVLQGEYHYKCLVCGYETDFDQYD